MNTGMAEIWGDTPTGLYHFNTMPSLKLYLLGYLSKACWKCQFGGGGLSHQLHRLQNVPHHSAISINSMKLSSHFHTLRKAESVSPPPPPHSIMFQFSPFLGENMSVLLKAEPFLWHAWFESNAENFAYLSPYLTSLSEACTTTYPVCLESPSSN